MNTVDWSGTWLQAVWLIRQRELSFWRELLDVWSDSFVLDQGTALLVNIHPESVGHAALMDPEYLPELHWNGDRRVIIEALAKYFPMHLELKLCSRSEIPEMRIDTIVNSDDSLSLYLSAPMTLFESVDPLMGRQRFHAFLDICTSLFLPKLVLAGTIGEEAQFDGVSSLLTDLDRWTGKGFYGKELAEALTKNGLSLPKPAVIQSCRQGGLFVSWADWPEWREAPQSWRNEVAKLLNAKSI